LFDEERPHRESEKLFIILISQQAKIYSKEKGPSISTYPMYSPPGNSKAFLQALIFIAKDFSFPKRQINFTLNYRIRQAKAAPKKIEGEEGQ
jgi:hypothetical protein